MVLNLMIFLQILFYAQPKATSVFPSFVHGMNEMWGHVKGGVSDVMDCIASKHKPTVDDVKFYLYTPTNKNDPEEIKDFKMNKSTNFNESLITKVLIHGYTQSYKSELLTKMRNVYVSTGFLNVIMVNWENLAYPACYPIAADDTGFVGQLTGYLLANLPPGKVHVIGFSLGAHVGGIGAQMQDEKVIRITGLDPAGPMFVNIPDTKRLDRTDAQYVDIIHTSIAGISVALGHAEFYVNGGKVQPGCSTADVPCSHRRSMELYLESITSNVGFKATMCDSLANFESNKCSDNNFTTMGEPWLSSGAKQGTFYVKTNNKAPYAIDEQ